MMLSISNVSDTKAAAGYYEQQDDYYTRDQQVGGWFGKGAEHLGLKGAVARERFTEILAGHLTDRTQIHRAAGGHRGGLDLTFSAPKSVSLMALLAGDQRVIEAHSKAVNKALAITETLAGYRVTAGGETKHQNSGNLLGASFIHELSRACDPQLHTHCVVMNATLRADGEWRALDNEPIYRAKMMLGAAYRAELAHELKALGYEINVTHNDGRFETAGWDQGVLKAFSQRSQAIEDYLLKTNEFPEQASAIEKKLAAVATRAHKDDVDRDALAELWMAQLKELGAQVPEIPDGLNVIEHPDATNSANAVVNRAIQHIAERESAFTRDQLVCAALQFGVNETRHDQVIADIEHRINTGELKSSGKFLTTTELQLEERKLLEYELEERSALASLSSGLPMVSTGGNLTAEQATAVGAILTNNSRMIAMVGKAGTGKTTTLKTAVEALRSSGVKVFGVAPSSNASRLLAEAGLETTTVSSFTLNGMHQKVARGGILIVDESGMLSTKQLSSLVAQARLHDFRLVLVGDPKQLAAVEAGKPYTQLIAAGMPTTTLRKIHRQKDPTLKTAVEYASEGNTKTAVATISHFIKEVPDRSQRFEDISDTYAKLTPSERAETIVVSGTRASRERINQMIREKLGLMGTGFFLDTLEKKDMTRQQAASIVSYEQGDLLVANRDYKALGLKRGDQARVVSIQSTSIRMADTTGREFDWRPTLAPDLSANRVVKREIAVGDLVRVTANMHRFGLVNGDQFHVIAIDAALETCAVELPNGSIKELSLKIPLPIDHAYCKTVYASQGATCERVLIEADTSSLTANQATFYVAISRARTEVKIFTDDAISLGPAMSRSVEKSSALEIIDPNEKFDVGIT